MPNNIKIIRAESQITNKWSGGTTTQLFIWPETSSYQERTFDWRISSAVVELEESDFTKLPDYSRLIMVLDGAIKLEHKDHHSIILKQFEQDFFQGSWETKCYGKCIDFNLMTNSKFSGKIEHFSVHPGKNLSINTETNNEEYQLFYIFDGNIDIFVDGEKSDRLNKSDLLIISNYNENNISFLNSSDKMVNIIKSSIYKK